MLIKLDHDGNDDLDDLQLVNDDDEDEGLDVRCGQNSSGLGH